MILESCFCLTSESATDALPYINAVRLRTQYAGGENRAAYYDGGNTLQSASLQTPGVANSFYPGNSYYESNIFR